MPEGPSFPAVAVLCTVIFPDGVMNPTSAMPLLQGLRSLYNLATLPSGYTTTPVFANNLADPNGIDIFGGTIDQCLWIALLSPKPANAAATAMHSGNSQKSVNTSGAIILPHNIPSIPPKERRR